MENILTIKDKILAFLSEKGIKKGDFFEITGIQSSNFKGKNMQSQPGGDMLVKILTTYPDLSAEWLLRGEGQMLKTKETTSNNLADPQPPHSREGRQKSPITQEKTDNFSFETLLATITKQAEEIGRLKARIEELERRRGDNVSDAATLNARVV